MNRSLSLQPLFHGPAPSRSQLEPPCHRRCFSPARRRPPPITTSLPDRDVDRCPPHHSHHKPPSLPSPSLPATRHYLLIRITMIRLSSRHLLHLLSLICNCRYLLLHCHHSLARDASLPTRDATFLPSTIASTPILVHLYHCRSCLPPPHH